ncbi:M20/M25/M40 family metallo-hydrolase [Alkalibacter saccharofermentans]|uniref:D-alanine-D-alanine ligase n=1 Tax=Alkalibacter saccharofermentans DSM 14828 TaxID=1120975 RepID=A0A1M4X3N7_9FIRM|nr:M20/M25/M40 family metallo-hydrolase [Alkalibacter saccharofermentans]SHE88057.1 D-alanine-D-alanine ligase [Alkalibacter saccharofermentans DSM 14828]
MKIAIIYNRDSQAVINLFGRPNREKYGLGTIDIIKKALEEGGHQVKTFEGDKNIISALEDFMPSVISGERPGLVFNLSYGIQGRARYTHIPGILEMLGIPYVGSSPETHAVALDKVLTKMVLMQKGLPTPKFTVLDTPDFDMPLQDDLKYPLIVKPKDEAVSFGLKIVNNEEELREGVKVIYDMFNSPTLVEEYIDGREVNVGLLGNTPVEALPPVEIAFSQGEKIFTYEDKKGTSGRTLEKICPAPIDEETTKKVQNLAIETFRALGCFDSARVDFRLDKDNNPYILEVNSMASLGKSGSYVFAAEKIGLDYNKLVNKLIEIASLRYFGPMAVEENSSSLYADPKMISFSYLTQQRDKMEEELKEWTNIPSWTGDPVGIGTMIKRLEKSFEDLEMTKASDFTNNRSAWTWETTQGFEGGTLMVVTIDVPHEGKGGYPIPFRREPEWLYGEGIASSRAGIACVIQALSALKIAGKIEDKKLGVFIYSDEGRGMRYSSHMLRLASAKAKEVIIMQPGFLNGKVVDQHRGSRKYSILVEGPFQRTGAHTTTPDAMSWFLAKSEIIRNISRPKEMINMAVQEVHSERYSILLPHRVRATVYLSFLDKDLAQQAEDALYSMFENPSEDEISVYIQKLEERPPLNKSERTSQMTEKLRIISEEWKLPFGTESGLLPTAGGEVPESTDLICGFGPASRDMFTPNECIHRGELLQRALLLTMYLLDG